MNQVEICNLALIRIGVPKRITAIDEDSLEAIACLAVWEQTLNDLLTDHPWSFATEAAELSEISGGPDLEEWEYAYQIPNDCLFVRRLVYNNEYEIFGDEIHTDAEGDDAWAVYTKEIDDPEDLPYKFCSALAYKLAINIVVTIMGDRKGPNIIESLYSLYEVDLDKAKTFDATQGNHPDTSTDSWLTART